MIVYYSISLYPLVIKLCMGRPAEDGTKASETD